MGSMVDDDHRTGKVTSCVETMNDMWRERGGEGKGKNFDLQDNMREVGSEAFRGEIGGTTNHGVRIGKEGNKEVNRLSQLQVFFDIKPSRLEQMKSGW
jgi:hypothetical protein